MTMLENEELMAICAIRYCIGRESYIVHEGIEWAMRYGRKSPNMRRLIIEEIERATNHGSPSDKEQWMAVLQILKGAEAAEAGQ